MMNAVPALPGLSVNSPVLAAPMAGGASTPALVIAAARAGGLGFLAAGYKAPGLLAEQIRDTRADASVFGLPHSDYYNPLAGRRRNHEQAFA